MTADQIVWDLAIVYVYGLYFVSCRSKLKDAQVCMFHVYDVRIARMASENSVADREDFLGLVLFM